MSVCAHEPTRSDRSLAFACMRVTFWKMSAEKQPFVMSQTKKSVPGVETCIHLCHSVLRCYFLLLIFYLLAVGTLGGDRCWRHLKNH